MSTAAPPAIFSAVRRIAARRRMLALQRRADAPRYVIEDMIEDMLERLAFVRLAPRRALVVGDYTGVLAGMLGGPDGAMVESVEPARGFDEERPYGASPLDTQSGYDLIASLGTLDTVNDLPGALIHAAQALAPGGMLVASFVGAGSLPRLRDAMLTADAERPAPRIHPQIDVRAGAQLLQRAGLADPVADGRSLDVRFGSLARLVGDLRAQGCGNVLAERGPPLDRAALARAAAAFAASDTPERFEIVTLSGWRRPGAGCQT